MNIRERGEHSYTGHDSYTNNSVNVVSGANPLTCEAGHSACKVDYTTSSFETTQSVSNTTKTTRRALPLNIRSKAHSHSYDKVNVSTDSTDVTYHTYTASNCPDGHTNCVATWEAHGATYYRITSRSFVAETTPEWKPSPGFNIREKISHSHTLNDVIINITTSTVLGSISRLSCGNGHNYCTMWPNTSDKCTGISTAGCTSGSAYE